MTEGLSNVAPIATAEQWGDHRHAREQRGKRRKIAHLSAAADRSSSSLTFLEVNTVRESTAARYRQALDDFQKWMTTNMMDDTTVESVDQAVIEFLEDRYFKGYGANTGEFLLCALRFYVPSFRESTVVLPRAHRALRGYRRLSPGFSRAPLPAVALSALVGSALFAQDLELAVAMVVCFICYLRPGELLSLKANQIILPVRGSQTSHAAVLLAPFEGQVATKTGKLDDSVIIDWKELPSVTKILAKLAGNRGDQKLWSFNHTEFNKKFAEHAEKSGVSALRPHPYALRHGGASFDAFHRRREVGANQLRGRWRAESSVACYNKHARLMKEVAVLPAATREFGDKIFKDLDQYLGGKLKVKQLPRINRVLGTASKRRRA